MARAGQGVERKMEVVFPAVPRSMLSEVKAELQTHAAELLQAWTKPAPAQRSASLLSTALCLLHSCSFDARRTLAPLVQEAGTAQATGISELWEAVWLERAAKPLAASGARMRYLHLHLERQPPVDAWPWLQTALAEAAVAISLPLSPPPGGGKGAKAVT